MKCTPQLGAAIATTVHGGSYPEVAAVMAGVDVATFTEWVTRGDGGEQPYAAFVAQIHAAEAHAEALATTSAMKAIQALPAAALGLLERRFGRRWASGGPASPGSRSWMESAFPGRGGGSIHRDEPAAQQRSYVEQRLRLFLQLEASAHAPIQSHTMNLD